MVDFTTLDSGRREEYKTGARRDVREGKGRFDLIPTEALHRWAALMERGAAKYGDRNWECGLPLSRFLDSAFRHLVQLIEGREDEDHASAVLFNVGGFISTLARVQRGELPKELDDRATSSIRGGGVDA